MAADLTKPFAESCCDGGVCSTNANSAQPCGCDPGAKWVCQVHQALASGPDCLPDQTSDELIEKAMFGRAADQFIEDQIFDRMVTHKWDWRFLDLAKLVSTWSKDPSTQTGAVITGPNNAVISVGFNGFPAGMPDGKELYANRDEKYSRVVHCEVNALIYAGRPLPAGCTLYTVPFMSCDRCVVQMLQARIRRFVAPTCTDPEKLARWGEAFNKTRTYIRECGGSLLEI